MSEEVAAAPVEESDVLDMPIDIVGDKVKSGRNILADYDPATGSVSVRGKWKHLTDAILAVVDEVEEGSQAEKFRGTGTPVDEKALESAQETVDKLDAELEAKAKEDAPQGLSGVDMSKLDPNVAAMLMAQQAQLNAMMASLNKDDATIARTRDMGVIEEGKLEARQYAQRLADDIEFAKANEGVPMPPKKNPRFGDKTPAYVNWLKEFRPDLYMERYGITDHDRQITLRTRDGQPMKVTADVGRRKVHTSHKPDRDPSLAPDQDWNA